MFELVEVDIDLVNELRNSGRGSEAHALLLAWREHNRKQKVVDFGIFTREWRLKVRSKAKRLGLCTQLDCFWDSIEGKNLCLLHSRKLAEFREKGRGVGVVEASK